MAVGDLLHIVLDILRIGGDNGAVVVIACLGEFVSLIEESRVENKVGLLLHEPLDVTVGQLGRVALGLTGDGLDTQLIKLVGRGR